MAAAGVPARPSRRHHARSFAVRRLTRLGHPRLRSLTRRLDGSPVLGAIATPALRWLERGELRVASGLGWGLRMSMAGLSLDHAHLGGFAHGGLESSVQEAMLRHLPPGGVLFDVGANVGFFALLGARMAGPQGRVFAFEPVGASADAIRRNAELNGFANLEVIEAAVGAVAGRGRLQVVDDRSWSKLVEYGGHPGVERVVEVDVVSVDELVAAERLPAPDVVKIDVEGAELPVLAGMARTAAEHAPAIICELHGTQREFAALMASWGYRTINLEGTQPVEEAGASAHALALPPDSMGD